MEIEITPADDEVGPAMAALSDRHRKFVRAMVALGRNGILNVAEAARIAGYSDTAEGAKVRGHNLAHDARVQAAILEESRKQINLAASLVATPVCIEVAMDREAPKRDRLRACEMLFNRGGLPAQTEHRVTIDDRRPKQLAELAAQLARELGLDEQKLLGINMAAKPVLEGEYVEVPDGNVSG